MKEPREKPTQSDHSTHETTIFINHKIPHKLKNHHYDIIFLLKSHYSHNKMNNSLIQELLQSNTYLHFITHFLPTQILPSHLATPPCLSTTHIFVLYSHCYSLPWGSSSVLLHTQPLIFLKYNILLSLPCQLHA